MSKKATKKTTAKKTQAKASVKAKAGREPASKPAAARRVRATSTPTPTADTTSSEPAADSASRVPPPGTVIQKLDRHGAVRCECAVEEAGIRYNGDLYRSLSGAAMAAAKDLGLTNKTQNGFTFWGITKPRRPGNPLESLDHAWERYHKQLTSLLNSVAAENQAQVATVVDRHATALHELQGQVAR